MVVEVASSIVIASSSAVQLVEVVARIGVRSRVGRYLLLEYDTEEDQAHLKEKIRSSSKAAIFTSRRKWSLILLPWNPEKYTTP